MRNLRIPEYLMTSIVFEKAGLSVPTMWGRDGFLWGRTVILILYFWGVLNVMGFQFCHKVKIM
ncbi:hypothetical protein B7453_09665 [Pseudomonas sp. IB20]|nr:hypothetical protein B7453_09665 [Pseudomonas sp. IB20]